MPQIQFILSMPDIPVVLQRRAHSAYCVKDRRDSTEAVPVVVQRLAPGAVTARSSGVKQLQCSGGGNWGGRRCFVCFLLG